MDFLVALFVQQETPGFSHCILPLLLGSALLHWPQVLELKILLNFQSSKSPSCNVQRGGQSTGTPQ